ncbi:MAG: [FeFe] hydrogenase H-cluster maturation GTPase HydF [Ruminococcaceae bacterium]|nr:[FeFe] hydrogenase H-cluster maturation GTPase HydF [Oscillospiraceae bacterium]
MSLNNTPSGERIHIGFFGMRNAGKSSLVNAVTGQELSVVSDYKGTTTDPVKKAMELLPLGAVLIIDTPGLDDEGELGALRVKKAKEVLKSIDVAVLTVDSEKGLSELDKDLITDFENAEKPYIIAYNKSDIKKINCEKENEISLSALTGENINELKEKLASLTPKKELRYIAADLIKPLDTVVMVVPIDESAPKGRIILPQQQTLREILDVGAIAVVCQDDELPEVLMSLAKKPKLVITDSQVFGKVAKMVPEDILLTSFSILFARYKGDLEELVKGAAALKELRSGDRVLISEGCTHHRQCNDIGSVKMPGWIKNFSSAEIEVTLTSGGEFPEDLSPYKVIVHCGGCMLNEAQMRSRIDAAKKQGVPIVNYGVAIAHMNGILKKTLAPFPEILKILE